jgi:hypothetical protein
MALKPCWSPTALSPAGRGCCCCCCHHRLARAPARGALRQRGRDLALRDERGALLAARALHGAQHVGQEAHHTQVRGEEQQLREAVEARQQRVLVVARRLALGHARRDALQREHDPRRAQQERQRQVLPHVKDARAVQARHAAPAPAQHAQRRLVGLGVRALVAHARRAGAAPPAGVEPPLLRLLLEQLALEQLAHRGVARRVLEARAQRLGARVQLLAAQPGAPPGLDRGVRRGALALHPQPHRRLQRGVEEPQRVEHGADLE